MKVERQITVTIPDDFEEGDDFELELLCSFCIPELSVAFCFDTTGLQSFSLKELQDFADGKSSSLVFFDSNGTCSISWIKNLEGEKNVLRFEVTRSFSFAVFDAPAEGIMEEIISQYKTFVKA